MFTAKRFITELPDLVRQDITPTRSLSRLDQRLDAYQCLQTAMRTHFAVEVSNIKKRDLQRAYSTLQHRNPFLQAHTKSGVLEFAEEPFEVEFLAHFKTIASFMSEVNFRCKVSATTETSTMFVSQKKRTTLISLVVSHAIADLQFLMVLMQDLIQIALYDSETPSRELRSINDYMDIQIGDADTSFSHLHSGVCRVNLPAEAPKVQAFDVRIDKLSSRDSQDILAYCKQNGFSMQIMVQLVHYLVKMQLFEHSASQQIGLIHAFNYAGVQGDCAMVEPVLVQSDMRLLRRDWKKEIQRLTNAARKERSDAHNPTVQSVRNCMYGGARFNMGEFEDDYTSSVPGFGKLEEQLLNVGVSMELCYNTPISEDKLYVCGLNGELHLVHNFLNSIDAENQSRIERCYKTVLQELAAQQRSGKFMSPLDVVCAVCKNE